MRVLPVSLLLLVLAPALAQTPVPAAPPTPPAANTGNFHDDSLHLTYSVPANYVDASAIVGPAFQASVGANAAAAASAKCISLPFSRMASTGEMDVIMLLHANAACLKKTFDAQAVASLTQAEVNGIATSGAKTNFGKLANFEVDHRAASALQGSFTLPTGQTLQSRVVCVLDQPDIVCWQFLSGTPEGLAAMAAFPVTFDGGAPASLQPAATH